MTAWNVYIGEKLMDTVFFDSNCSKWYVKNSLIEYDGYPDSIRITKAF